MPTYEYSCDKCGILEVTQRITEPALKRCPKCKGKIERIISHTSFVLKGKGWYATDYARSKPTEATSDNGTTEKAGDKKEAPSAGGGSADKTTASDAAGNAGTSSEKSTQKSSEKPTPKSAD